jgi:hypothetical protein
MKCPLWRKSGKEWVKNPLILSWGCISALDYAAQIWAVRICAPRSSVQIQFRTPLVILPLNGGGGVDMTVFQCADLEGQASHAQIYG